MVVRVGIVPAYRVRLYVSNLATAGKRPPWERGRMSKTPRMVSNQACGRDARAPRGRPESGTVDSCTSRARSRPLTMPLAPLAILGASLSAPFAVGAPPGDAWPRTRAEATEYRETSAYADVLAFLDRLQANDAPIRVSFIGESAGGRRIPLVVAARPPVATASEAQRSGRPVVYLQANIHGGEVEGKEAVLMLLRQLAQQPEHPFLRRLVLVVAPVYNVDGNERLGDARRNRASQDGPDPVGERPNGQGLDLNRDCMKAETPETRAVLRHVYAAWDPDVVLDLHTTNGTRHGYQLTYAPPLNPNTEVGIQRFARDNLLPTVRRRLRQEHSLRIFDYGNLPFGETPRGWYSFGEEPRYVTNYVGLRNRIAVLSEPASFRPFRARVDTTLRFVETVLDEVARQRGRVLDLTRAADARVTGWGLKPESAPPLGVRFEMTSVRTESIPLEKLPPGTQVDRRKAPTSLEAERLPVLDRFRATRSARLPAAYLVPAAHSEAVQLLRRHGISVERLRQPWRGRVDAFTVTELARAPSPFQGHRLVRVEGTFAARDAEIPAGDFVVRTAQPLGILLFHLLEPESLDGAAAWGFLDGALAVGKEYPMLKAFRVGGAVTEGVD